eukprot:TRINITY_DN23831_c0_g1_i1.p1 TRINITY_DN23831_c0_g1~~TRINITY_DN23831_c0_g1_i1.p1  ORF type:complete len:392 (+),score=163.42 TRINITY_DN23831_c0_g1_i1:42-1178(+)
MADTEEQKRQKLAALQERLKKAREEREEAEKDVDDLNTALQKVDAEVDKKNEEVRQLKMFRVKLQQSVENEEDYIMNNLTKRLDALQKEKAALVQQAQKEEEFINNTLQAKLKCLKQEKIDAENRLEQEQEHIVNKLQQELLKVSEERAQLQAKLHSSRGDLLKQLSEQAERQGRKTQVGDDTTTINKLGAEIRRLQDEHNRAETRLRTYESERKRLHTMLESLQKESKNREREQIALKNELEKVTEERKNLFIAAEQILEKKINSTLRSKKRKPGCRLRSASELSDSLSSSICSSSAISTPKLYDQHSISSASTSVSDKRRSSSVPLCRSPSQHYHSVPHYSTSTFLPPTTPTLQPRQLLGTPGFVTPGTPGFVTPL